MLKSWATLSIHIFVDTIKLIMIDPVGLAASVASLAELAFAIASALYKYSGDVKNAPDQSEQLRKELGDLQTICKIVQESVEVETKGLPEALGTQVVAFKATLDMMLKRAAIEKTSGLRRLKWPFTKSENVEYIIKIERFKSTLNLIVNIDQTYA